VLVTAKKTSTNGMYIASAKILSTSDPITKESSERATTDLLINIPAVTTTIKTHNTATTFMSESEHTTVRPIVSTATVYIVGDDANEVCVVFFCFFILISNFFFYVNFLSQDSTCARKLITSRLGVT